MAYKPSEQDESTAEKLAGLNVHFDYLSNVRVKKVKHAAL